VCNRKIYVARVGGNSKTVESQKFVHTQPGEQTRHHLLRSCRRQLLPEEEVNMTHPAILNDLFKRFETILLFE